MNKAELETPDLLIDLDQLERNIQTVGSLARRSGVALRPHVKTHKTPAIAHKQLDAGAVGVTVAKVGEAEIMAAAGSKVLTVSKGEAGMVGVREDRVEAVWQILARGKSK